MKGWKRVQGERKRYKRNSTESKLLSETDGTKGGAEGREREGNRGREGKGRRKGEKEK